MPRGFLSAIYVDDLGIQWRLRVDADEVEELGRGWQTDGAGELAPFPRGWLPRRVVGIDESGRQQEARIGNVEAPLWTGEEVVFSLIASDGSGITAAVVARQGEKRGF